MLLARPLPESASYASGACLGIPALTVIAGFYTLYLAFTSGPLDPVQASVQRVGKGQSLESPADSAASQGHYRAYLILDKQSNPWQLTLKTAPETLAALAAVAAGRARGPVVPTPPSGRRAPRLTEHWFC